MTIYGYCRVSTPKQSIERQIKNIIKACPEILERNIYLDRWTGSTTDRPQWKKLERRLKEGDTIFFDSVSRMSRQSKEGFALYKRLYDMGVNLIFLKEPYINTDQYKQARQISLPEVEDSCLKPLMNGLTETLMLLAQRQFIAAFEQAEKEVEDLRQRTREGFTPEARRKISESKQGRTKKSLDVKLKIKRLAKAFGGEFKDKEVIEFLQIDRNTYYKYKREMKQEMEERI